MCTSGVDGTSEISIEKIKGFLDFQDFLEGDIGGDEIVWIEGHDSW